MLIDDDKSVLQVLKHMLERFGYKVTAYSNCLSVIEDFKLAPYDFDVLITDMTMPDMTGEQLTIELKTIRHDLPVILCTGFSKNVVSEEAMGLLVDKILMKPIVMSELAKALRGVLDK